MEIDTKVVGMILLTAALVSCQTVQQTGRSQFIVVSESQERQLGEEAFEQTVKTTPLSTRSDWQTQLRRVGQRISAVAGKPDYKWE
ncbi:MAG: M48 family peptidase, partial [Pyrinomonadaceae bacterium]